MRDRHHERHEQHNPVDRRRSQRRGEGFTKAFGGGGGWEGGPGAAGGPFGRGRGRGGGPRMRRGDIRIALLEALAESPGHGYELIQRLEQRSQGRWRPSPGSVYPTLQVLEDSGFVTSERQDGKQVYTITDTGRDELKRLVEQSGGMPPWAKGGEDESEHGRLRNAGFQLFHAAGQVAMSGTTEQVNTTIGILDEARRKIYQLLAEA